MFALFALRWEAIFNETSPVAEDGEVAKLDLGPSRWNFSTNRSQNFGTYGPSSRKPLTNLYDPFRAVSAECDGLGEERADRGGQAAEGEKEE